MAESLGIYQVNGKPSTRKTNALTREQALQILEDAILKYQDAGGVAITMPEMYHEGQRMVAVVLPGVMVQDKHLVPLMAQEG